MTDSAGARRSSRGHELESRTGHEYFIALTDMVDYFRIRTHADKSNPT